MKYSDFLKTMSVCPFCDSARSSGVILENESSFLTYSLAPYHPDHLLVIPKRHMERLLEISDQEMRDIDPLQKQALLILKKFGYENISLLVREGDKSAKSVPHLHYHVIPNIRLGDTDHVGLDRMVMTEEEINALLSKIKNVLK